MKLERMDGITQHASRRRRLLIRGAPLVVLSVGAFALGVSVASATPEEEIAERFGLAWAAADYAAMHAELSPATGERYGPDELQRAYAGAARTATITELTIGDPRGPVEGEETTTMALPVDVRTSAFGTIGGEVGLPIGDDGVEWRPDLVFPGLEQDERLERQTEAPPRAPILAADRSPIAEGPADARSTVGAGGIVTGELGEAPRARAREMEQQGFPEGVPAGTSGLELAFDGILAGTPGGKLLAVGDAGERALAATKPIEGDPLRTTIDLKLQDAAALALGSRFGGAAVLDARNGDVLALAGVAFSAPQPPGSTMKVITVTAALEEGVTSLEQEYPVVASQSVDGYEIFNAGDQPCGGDLLTSFAQSCNTVFAPMGEELGAESLLEYSELFGFNAAPALYSPEALAATQPAESTIPRDLADGLDAAVSAIGQGEVLATPLEMASVAQTIANDGVRSPTALVRSPELAGDYPDTQVTSPEVADQVERMMVEVVKSGTGTAAALPNVVVAGKSGTAELGPASDQPSGVGEAEQDVDAWFTAYAPAEKPEVAVAVMIVDAEGDGGVIAAPIAQAILDAAL